MDLGVDLVRLIYIDEAGTSAPEPITVVVGLVVDADRQWAQAAQRIAQVISKVPSQFRDNFVFHATAVWGSAKYREGWSREDRMALLTEMMAIPRTIGIAIAYGTFYRDGEVQPAFLRNGLGKVQYQHAHAFGTCIGSADEYIEKFAAPNEIAAVVAEDIPEMRKSLRESAAALRNGALTISGARLTQQIAMHSKVKSNIGLELRIRRMIDDVHFTPKGDAPLLQAADAVAFGLRRYYAQQSSGIDFARAIIGPDAAPAERHRDCACGFMCHEAPSPGGSSPFTGSR